MMPSLMLVSLEMDGGLLELAWGGPESELEVLGMMQIIIDSLHHCVMIVVRVQQELGDDREVIGQVRPGNVHGVYHRTDAALILSDGLFRGVMLSRHLFGLSKHWGCRLSSFDAGEIIRNSSSEAFDVGALRNRHDPFFPLVRCTIS
jgi:hypothetical protein